MSELAFLCLHATSLQNVSYPVMVRRYTKQKIGMLGKKTFYVTSILAVRAQKFLLS